MATIEQDLVTLLGPLVNGRVYADTPPTVFDLPFISYQQVGGEAYQYVEKKLPGHQHSRIQVNVWAKTRSEANTIARNIEQAVIESELTSEAYGALEAIYDDDVKIYGTRQDFGFWHVNIS